IRAEMQGELLRLQQVRRRTIVFISHDLDEAMRIGDRIAIMKDGQVKQVGTPEEILRAPADDYVRAFVRGVDAAAVFTAGDIALPGPVKDAGPPVAANLPVSELFGLVARSEHPLPVIGDGGRYVGAISKTTLLKFLDRGAE
ncbi:MAG TPA: glycine betaine/L-proline ABC transporter ATP-binding protein, partial [Ramlibacter sp.]|nr:glycine betaine/L-proline ABC transporter ATP-binding protein [Ramlibacter sp.]